MGALTTSAGLVSRIRDAVAPRGAVVRIHPLRLLFSGYNQAERRGPYKRRNGAFAAQADILVSTPAAAKMLGFSLLLIAAQVL